MRISKGHQRKIKKQGGKLRKAMEKKDQGQLRKTIHTGN